MFVPWDEQIVTIDSIGPSLAFEFLNGCRLKAVLSKYPNSINCQNGIPIHPNSSIGTIFHRLLEAARKNKPSNENQHWDVKFANSVLDSLTNTENERLEKNELNSHLTPLQNQPVYFSRCMNGVFAAVKINSQTAIRINQPANKPSGEHILFGAEINVWDLEETWQHNLGKSDIPKFSIFGQIDRVSQNKNRVIIEDFKTGQIFDENNELKESYITQLRLYAELWLLTAKYRHGIDIPMSKIDLYIIDDTDTRHTISTQYRENITSRIRELLRDVNQEIVGCQDNYDLSYVLAEPNDNSCRFCKHRTGCSPYLDKLINNSGFIDEGFDLVGTLESPPIPNGVGSKDYQFKLKTDTGIWLVDKVHERWIISDNLKLGETIGVFGGFEVTLENCLGFNRFFKCSTAQHAVYQLV